MAVSIKRLLGPVQNRFGFEQLRSIDLHRFRQCLELVFPQIDCSCLNWRRGDLYSTTKLRCCGFMIIYFFLSVLSKAVEPLKHLFQLRILQSQLLHQLRPERLDFIVQADDVI